MLIISAAKNKKILRRQFIYFATLFSAIAFTLHFGWEIIQCSPFFRHIQNPPDLRAMAFAASGDLLMTWSIYLVMAAIYKSYAWFSGHWNVRSLMATIGLSLLFAVLVELWALRAERWAYTEINPLVPLLGVSILPLMQMALIVPASIFGSKKILNGW